MSTKDHPANNHPTDKRSDRRDHLVETALRLFYRDGFHATGIDTILAEAGVAKMTLYKHFKTKEDLILAALALRDDRWSAWFKSRVEALTPDPHARLLALFDALHEWFSGLAPIGRFCGCAFINSAAEYADFDHPIHRLAAAHKRAVRDQIRLWAHAASLPDPDTTADHLTLLVEGAIVMSHVAGDPHAAPTARAAAQSLLRP